MQIGTRRPLVPKLSIGDLRPLLWLRAHRNVSQSKLGNTLTGSDIDDVVGLWEDNSHAESLGAELLSNPDFEAFTGTADDGTSDDFDNWAEGSVDDGNGNKIEAVSSPITSGSYAVKLSRGTASPYMWQDISVTAGYLYKLSFFTQGDGASAGRFQLDNRNNGDILPLQGTGVSAAAYSKIVRYFTVPIGCSTVRLIVRPPTGVGSCAYFDNTSLKQVLTPLSGVEQATTAKKPLRRKQGVEFDGSDDYMAQKSYCDETGASWGPANHGLSLVDGNAFLRVEGVDLSPFAGVEGTDTPYMVVLTDQAGKVAWSYLGAADAAEGLNTELVLNPGLETAGAGDPDFWANWTETVGDGAIADEGVLVHTGSHAAKVTAGPTSLSTRVSQFITVVPGKLYKVSFWARGDGTHPGRYNIFDVTNAAAIIDVTSTTVSGTIYTEVTAYFTAPAGCVAVALNLRVPSTDTGIAYFDDASVKEVLHAGADAVHLVSTRHGSTRNWAGIDAAFDYNDSAYTLETRKSVFNGTWTTGITLGAWARPQTNRHGYILAKCLNTTGLPWYLRTVLGRTFFFRVGTSGGTVALNPAFTYTDNNWYFLVGTYDGATGSLYVNGNELANVGVVGTVTDDHMQFRLGRSADDAHAHDGDINDAFILDYALDARSIKRLYEDNKERYS